MTKNRQLLFDFEERYPCLYDVQVGGVAVYACLRDDVLAILRGVRRGDSVLPSGRKGRVYLRRLAGTFVGFARHRQARTLIFTSAIYRRDHGRNLAAEWLMGRYSDAVVFEWLSRNEAFDGAWFADALRDRFVPIDGYLVLYKLHSVLHRKRCKEYETRVREQLAEALRACPEPANEAQAAALAYVRDQLPVSCAKVAASQEVFRWLFRRYDQVETSVDFWGSARENITPVLPGSPRSVELQHGIITHEHPGYVYPPFVGGLGGALFERTILAYDEGTKRILTHDSIFRPEQIEVVGNPRVALYQREYGVGDGNRDLVLFTSQPYEQDGSGSGYYAEIIPQLAALQDELRTNLAWAGCRLAVKLHPREDDAIAELYRRELPEAEVFGRAAELYDLLCRTRLHVTVSSTVLYEAESFGVPTVLVRYGDVDARELFGREVPMLGKVCPLEGLEIYK